MSTATSTQFHLASRPAGWPTAENFRLVHAELGELAEGEVRVQNEFVSVDPYMRGRMNDTKSYVPPFKLDRALQGGAVGRVIESAASELPVGTLVLHDLGWRDVAQGSAKWFRAISEREGISNSAWLGILGMPGTTAYAGLTAVAGVREGDSVFVSGAAGAVGTAAGQIAKLLGAKRVIGSAGSPEKVARLTEKYGYDAAFNYKDGPVWKQLRDAAGEDGIDVFFDNVGGDHLEAAIGAMNDFGRAALCGAIASYNSAEVLPGPRNMWQLTTKRLRLQGFIVSDYPELRAEFEGRMVEWLTSGQVTYEETVVDGVEQTAEAFLAMMRGENTGKMVVRV